MTQDAKECRKWLADYAARNDFIPSRDCVRLWEMAQIAFIKKYLYWSEFIAIRDWLDMWEMEQAPGKFPILSDGRGITQRRSKRAMRKREKESDAVHVHLQQEEVRTPVRRNRPSRRDAEEAALSEMRKHRNAGFLDSEYFRET